MYAWIKSGVSEDGNLSHGTVCLGLLSQIIGVVHPGQNTSKLFILVCFKLFELHAGSTENVRLVANMMWNVSKINIRIPFVCLTTPDRYGQWTAWVGWTSGNHCYDRYTTLLLLKSRHAGAWLMPKEVLSLCAHLFESVCVTANMRLTDSRRFLLAVGILPDWTSILCGGNKSVLFGLSRDME